MSIAADSACYLCHFRRHIANAQALGDGDTATAFAKELMQLYLAAPADVPITWISPQVAALYDKYYHTGPDRHAEEKEMSNRFVLERMDAIRSRAENAADPVYAGLQGAILGNYIDFSALQGEISFEKLDEMLSLADNISVDNEAYAAFCRDLEKGKNLLILTDNAGEIGFDRIFAEQIRRKYPHLVITFCVKGGPAVNDATRQDAEAVGIDFPIIDTGCCMAGALLQELGEEAKNALFSADVILSKGQANVETLYGCGLNIYYAFLIKCQRFIDIFGKEKFTPMLVKEKK